MDRKKPDESRGDSQSPAVPNRRAFLTALGAAGVAAASACRSETAKPDASTPSPSRRSLLDGVRGLGPEVYLSRLDRLRSLLNERGVDGLLLESSINLRYLTQIEFGRSERLFLVWLPAWGEPSVVCPAFEEARAREGATRVAVATFRAWREEDDPYRRVAEVLAEAGARTGTIAIEPTTRFFVAQGVARVAPAAALVDGAPLLDSMRMVKTPAEIALQRKAIEVTERAFEEAFATTRAGHTESDLGAAISRSMGELGTGGGALVLFGPNAAYPHGTAKREAARDGTVLLCDGGTDVQGYKSDITRTRVLGSPSAQVREVWQIVHAAQAAGFKAAGPGVPCQEVDRAARRVIEEAGYGEFFTHRLGHGIGMEGHEHPYLVEGNTRLLMPGHTTTVEPGIYIPGKFGVRIEDMIVVTESGCEVLSHPPERLESV